jgi:hypothetical protein
MTEPSLRESASCSADLVFITPADDDSLRAILAEPADIRGTDVKLFADLYVSPSGLSDKRSVTAVDLTFIVDEGVPLLRDGGSFRTDYREGETLRARLGLPVAENRYQEANRP